MNILSINTFFPYPPRKGMDVVYLNLLKSQALRHNVTLVSLRRSGTEDEHIKDILQYCGEVHLVGPRVRSNIIKKAITLLKYKFLSWFTWKPVCTFYDTPEELKALVHRLTKSKKYEIVEIHHSPCAELVQSVVHGVKILYMYDVHYRSCLRAAETNTGKTKIGWYIEASRFRCFERAIVRHFDALLFGQSADLSEMRSAVSSNCLMRIMPNIVDTDLFCPSGEIVEKNTLIFVGAMTHRANVDAIVHFKEDLWDKVRDYIPDAQLRIVGSSQPHQIKSWSGMNGIKSFSDVPDVRQYIASSSVYIAPLRIGSGVKVKIMEALAMGKAVVATPVAAEGMELVDGRNIIVRPLGKEFVDGIVKLLQDNEFRQSIERNARETALEKFSFSSGMRQLDSIYRDLGVLS